MDTSVNKSKFRRTKFACFSAYFTMSSVFVLPPLLFLTFRETYNLSYALLGTLVIANFSTQLFIDLIFSFFSSKFNVKLIVKIMPLITTFGLLTFALTPLFFPSIAFIGLIIGTIIFSFAAGFSEVLLSPTIAAIPNEDPQKNMSLLHSLYGIGVFAVILLSTLFFELFGTKNWAYLTIFFAFLPIIPAVLFMTSPLPEMNMGEKEKGTTFAKKRTVSIALCFLCIFFGSCAEGAMTNWISSYLEKALGLDKSIGDVLGMALFAIILAVTRILYAKFGKNICKTLLVGMIGAIFCYLIAGFSPWVIPAFIACVLTGMFTSMLWPGTLIMMEEKVPSPSVSAYALMAAGGDLGACVAPEIMGIVVDSVSISKFGIEKSSALGISAEQFGLKVGMIASSLFAVIGAVVLIITIRYFKKNPLKEQKIIIKDTVNS